MFCMNKLIAFAIFILLVLLFPFRIYAQDDTEEESGRNYPSEIPTQDTNKIEANRNQLGNFPTLKSPGFSNDLKIAAQSQNETRPNYYVLEGYVDMAYQGIR